MNLSHEKLPRNTVVTDVPALPIRRGNGRRNSTSSKLNTQYRLKVRLKSRNLSFFPQRRYADCWLSVVRPSTDTLPITLSQPCSSKERHWCADKTLTNYLKKVINISNEKSRHENLSPSSTPQRRCRRNTAYPIRECIRLPSARAGPRRKAGVKHFGAAAMLTAILPINNRRRKYLNGTPWRIFRTSTA